MSKTNEVKKTKVYITLAESRENKQGEFSARKWVISIGERTAAQTQKTGAVIDNVYTAVYNRRSEAIVRAAEFVRSHASTTYLADKLVADLRSAIVHEQTERAARLERERATLEKRAAEKASAAAALPEYFKSLSAAFTQATK